MQASVPVEQKAEVKALVMDELLRLHEGALAQYGLRPSFGRVGSSGDDMMGAIALTIEIGDDHG